MYETVNDIRTMLWIGGRPEKIKDKFNKVLEKISIIKSNSNSSK